MKAAKHLLFACTILLPGCEGRRDYFVCDSELSSSDSSEPITIKESLVVQIYPAFVKMSYGPNSELGTLHFSGVTYNVNDIVDPVLYFGGYGEAVVGHFDRISGVFRLTERLTDDTLTALCKPVSPPNK